MSSQERRLEDVATPKSVAIQDEAPGLVTMLRGAPAPAQIVALQRTAGNGAVTRLLQRDAIVPKRPDELLVHVLRGAAFRAHEARLILQGKDKAEAAKRFGSERADLVAQLSEAILLIAKGQPSREAFQAADSLFGSASQLVKLAESRGWEGTAGVHDKLAELKSSLEKRGYRYPDAQIKAGKTGEPRERGAGDLMRAARLGIAAGRAEIQKGQAKLAADRKAGRTPTQLHGAEEAAVHLNVAGLQLMDIYQLDHDQLRVVLRDIEAVANAGLALLREGERLRGGKALLIQINALSNMVGLPPITPFGTPTAASSEEARAEAGHARAKTEGRSKAGKALTTFERALTDFAKDERRWEESNYIDYLTKTSSNPRVSWGNSTAFGIFAEGLSSAAGTGVVKYLRHRSAKAAAAGATGAAVGAAVGNAPGAAVGFVIGVLVEYAVTFLLDHLTGKSDAEARAAAQAVAKNNQLIQQQLVVLSAKEDKAVEETRKSASDLTKRVDASDDLHELRTIHDEAEDATKSVGKKPAASDRSMMNAMLRHWVLQHAGDEDEANTETSDDQWTEARTIAFGKGRSLDNHPEIFAHQSLGHWESLGLAGIATAEPMIKEAEAAGSKGADRMMDAYDDKVFVFDKGTRNPDAFIKFVEKGERRKLTDEGKQAIREGRFKLKATFDLHQYKGAVYVDNWEYELTLIGPSMTQWWERGYSGRRLSGGAIASAKSRESTVEFDVNPDDD